MRLADYVMEFLADRGVRHVFMVTGGGAMHLNDAVSRERRWTWVCNHHEQASAMAAEAYARLSNQPALVNVTSGPGGINALNGVYGAYVDSIPMIVVSGQVKRATMARNYDLPLRQLGDQEIHIIDLARPVTKYAVCVQDPATIRTHLEQAWHLAVGGRPGPVWLDIPIDVQAARIDPALLTGFVPAEQLHGGHLPSEAGALDGDGIAREVADSLERLQRASRPVIFAGAGVRLAGARHLLLRIGAMLNIPIVTGWNAHDLVPDAHPSYAGRPGTVGTRQGNFTVQNADFLLILGSRLNIRQISYNWQSFARFAYKVMVDIDRAELDKPTLSIDRKVHAPLLAFMAELEAQAASLPVPAERAAWLAWCRERGERYPVVDPAYELVTSPINPYVFMRDLFERLAADEIVVCGDGTACVVAFQAARIKEFTRLFTNSGSASMGYDLPAAIGAHFASGRRVICLAGDGSIMMNLQELQTIAGLRLPIRIVVLNNDGYHSIRQTQEAYFPDSPIGFDAKTGVSFPDFVAVATGFGIPARRCAALDDLGAALSFLLNESGPALLEIILDPRQGFAPKLASRVLPDGSMASPDLEDMAPFLPREELDDNMAASRDAGMVVKQ